MDEVAESEDTETDEADDTALAEAERAAYDLIAQEMADADLDGQTQQEEDELDPWAESEGRTGFAHYQAAMPFPMQAGSPMTLRQHVHAMLAAQHASGGTSKIFNDLTWFQEAERGPLDPAVLPPSDWMMRKLIGFQGLEAYQYHSCVNDCHSWDFVPKDEWNSIPQKDRECPTCKEPRFEKRRSAARQGFALVPRKVILPI